MKTSHETTIAYPAGRIDLMAWLASLSDRDYQACSRAHRAAGIYRQDGKLGMVNVESVGGNLLVQHYLAAESSPNRVVMRSKDTRVYVSHLMPATIEVIWTVEVKPLTAASSSLRCSVETQMPAALAAMSTLTLLPYFLARHTREETGGFAADISRKIAAGGLGPAVP